VISTGIRAKKATMQMRIWMRRNKHCHPMIDQHRMWTTEGIVGATCEPVMLTGISARIAMRGTRMKRKQHRKPMIDQSRMVNTEGIVLESRKIGQYSSDM
jgi:hypothetical protein